MSVINTLIYDRTEELIRRAKYGDTEDYYCTGVYRFRAADGAYLIVSFDTSKGFYNAEDLNRIGQAVEYIADRLKSAGYAVEINPKIDWSMVDIPDTSQMMRYLDDVETIRAALQVLPTTPETPDDMENLNWKEANDIEKILDDVDYLLTKSIQARFFSGDLFSGEV